MENKFEYTYSAAQQKEVERIREKYAPKETAGDKLEELRRLDRSVESAGTTVSLVVGILGALILGTGMACVLEWQMYVVGLLVGLIGLLACVAAYPLYRKVVAKKKEQVGPLILRLSEELEKGEVS